MAYKDKIMVNGLNAQGVQTVMNSFKGATKTEFDVSALVSLFNIEKTAKYLVHISIFEEELDEPVLTTSYDLDDVDVNIVPSFSTTNEGLFHERVILGLFHASALSNKSYRVLVDLEKDGSMVHSTESFFNISVTESELN